MVCAERAKGLMMVEGGGWRVGDEGWMPFDVAACVVQRAGLGRASDQLAADET